MSFFLFLRIHTEHVTTMDLNDIPRMLINIAGSAMIGVGVGHLGFMALPKFDIKNETLKDVSLGTSGVKVLAMAAVNAATRLSAEVLTAYSASEFLLRFTQGADPTNGGIVLMTMMMSDPLLKHDFMVLNQCIHALMGNGINIKELTGLLEDEASKLGDTLTTMTENAVDNVTNKLP